MPMSVPCASPALLPCVLHAASASADAKMTSVCVFIDFVSRNADLKPPLCNGRKHRLGERLGFSTNGRFEGHERAAHREQNRYRRRNVPTALGAQPRARGQIA